MKEKLKNEIKQLTEDEIRKICTSLKEVFSGGIVIENPEEYQSAMKRYYEK